MDKIEQIFSISEYIEFINAVLDHEVKITGEVSKVDIGPTGHVYYSLKDKKGSVLNCIIWNFDYRISGVKLEEGLQIVAFGKPNVYKQRGTLSFVSKKISLIDEGDLKKQYELLKKQLEKEGVFDRELEIPKYPKKIGLITSKNGAVIHDFLNNLGKFNFEINFIDSRVEGLEALEELMRAVDLFREKDIEVLVVIRGGGSKESFEIFNNEALIRKIIDYPVPIIAGLGHHKDVPLFALASDKIVSTPSIAATLLSESWEELTHKIEKQEQVILNHFSRILYNFNLKIERTLNSFNNLENKIKRTNTYLEEYFEKINFKNLLQIKKEKLIFLERFIKSNDPKKPLKLGYSIVSMGGKVVKSIQTVKKDDLIDLELSDGIINSKVYDKHKK